MVERAIIIAISLLAAVIAMIIHELTKSIVYLVYVLKNEEQEDHHGIFKLWNYIDGIGLLLSMAGYGIFSRQYPFVIRSKKAAILIGLTGYLSMFLLFIGSGLLFHTFYPDNIVITKIEHVSSISGMLYMYGGYFLEYICFHSITLFIVNLFPLASFDISLIIAGKYPTAFQRIRKSDAIFKLIFMIVLILNTFTQMGTFAIYSLLT